MSQIEAGQKETSLSPLSLAIRHNISNDSVTTVLSELRKERKLRELSMPESGKKISEKAKGTFFFPLGGWLESETKWEGEIKGEIKVDDFVSPFIRHEIKRIRPSES